MLSFKSLILSSMTKFKLSLKIVCIAKPGFQAKLDDVPWNKKNCFIQSKCSRDTIARTNLHNEIDRSDTKCLRFFFF